MRKRKHHDAENAAREGRIALQNQFMHRIPRIGCVYQFLIKKDFFMFIISKLKPCTSYSSLVLVAVVLFVTINGISGVGSFFVCVI